MSSIFQQHCQQFAKEEHDRQVIMHALLDTDKKLEGVDIAHAIDVQFEPDDLDEMIACGMTIQDIVDYTQEKTNKIKNITESLSIAAENHRLLLERVKERFGGNYNDQT